MSEQINPEALKTSETTSSTSSIAERPGIATSEGVGTIGSTFVLLVTAIATAEVPVQVAAIAGASLVMAAYSISRALVKRATCNCP